MCWSVLDFLSVSVPTAVWPFGPSRPARLGWGQDGRRSAALSFVTAASRDGCCSKLNVVEVSAAAAVETNAVAHSVDDKQPATLNTNTPWASSWWYLRENHCAYGATGVPAKSIGESAERGVTSRFALICHACAVQFLRGVQVRAVAEGESLRRPSRVNSRAVEFCEDGVPATGCEEYFLSGSRYAAVWREIQSVSKVSICWKSAGLVKR